MKFPLSIFNFSTLQLPFSRVLTPTAAIVIGVLIVLELVVRFLVPDGHHPTGSWHNHELRIQAGQLEAMNHVDLMITGSSVAAVNFPPLAMEAVFSERGVNQKIFNAGIRGCDYEGIAEGFRTVFWQRKHASHVMLVVTPVDVNEANQAVRRRSADFIRSFNTPPHAAKAKDLLSNSWLFGFRGEIFEFIKTQDWIHEVPMVSQQGHIDMGNQQRKRYDLELNIYRDGPTAQALLDLSQWLIDRNVKLIVVEGPMDSQITGLVSKDQRLRFDALIQMLQALENTHYINATDLIPPDGEFIDQLHLNTDAAKQYASRLAIRLLEDGFPW